MSGEDEIRQAFDDLADLEKRREAIRGLAGLAGLRRSGRPEDSRDVPVVLLRFYDDDHGPCGSFTVSSAGGAETLAVPVGAQEVTVELVLPEPGGLAGATDAEVLFAAERLMDRYPEPGVKTSLGLHGLMKAHIRATAERAREAGYPSPAEDARASNAKWEKR